MPGKVHLVHVVPLLRSNVTTTDPYPESLEAVQNLVSSFSKISLDIAFVTRSWFLTPFLSSAIPKKSFNAFFHLAMPSTCSVHLILHFLSYQSYVMRSTIAK